MPQDARAVQVADPDEWQASHRPQIARINQPDGRQLLKLLDLVLVKVIPVLYRSRLLNAPKRLQHCGRIDALRYRWNDFSREQIGRHGISYFSSIANGKPLPRLRFSGPPIGFC